MILYFNSFRKYYIYGIKLFKKKEKDRDHYFQV